MVQEEIKFRKGTKREYNGRNLFFMKIRCGVCGAYFCTQTWHSTLVNNRKTMLVFHNRKTVAGACKSPSLSEVYIQRAFLIAFKEIFGEKEKIKENIQEKIDLFQKDKILEERQNVLNNQIIELHQKLEI